MQRCLLTPVLLVLLGLDAAPSSAADAAAASAGASKPALAGKTNGRTLGLTDSMLRYCTRVAPTSAPALQARRATLIQGLSSTDLARLEHSTDYQQAFQSEDQFLAMVDERNVHRVCPAADAPKKGS
jgi:hypothetical protein